MARSMLSLGTELSLAFCTAEARVMFPSRLPPPSRAATSTARSRRANVADRRLSVASFFRLIVLHLEWPDTALHLPQQVFVQARLSRQLRMEGRHQQVPLLG